MAARPSKTASTPEPEEDKPAIVRINRISVERLIVPISGTAPLISHRFDEKARKQMLVKQTARKSLKEPRNPEAEYNASLYRIYKPDLFGDYDELDLNEINVYGFPASAFRKATIGAARFYDRSVTMRGLTQMFMVKGLITKADPLALVEILGKPQPREDHVRLPNGNAEVRFRGEFLDWHCNLEFEYVASSIDAESLLSLVDAGGRFVGVGDWRPEKTGQFGTYEIDGDPQVVKA